MSDVRGVLDANLLASGLVSPQGSGNALIAAARLGRFQLVISSYLMAEVRETLEEVFRVNREDVEALLEFIEGISLRFEPAEIPPLCRDPDDDAVLALADQSGAGFLATYDHGVMAVGSVGGCGVVHPDTALQLVMALNPEVAAEGIPGTSGEDRSGWRVEEGGPPLDAAVAFIEWLKGLPAARERGREMVTPRSWKNFQKSIADGTAGELVKSMTHWASLVRYPADGMAYIFFPKVHPDQTEAFIVHGPTAMEMNVVTLLQRKDRWLVHQIGAMVSPADLGLRPYSW